MRNRLRIRPLVGAAGAIAAACLLSTAVQPAQAAALHEYEVEVTFDNVTFKALDDSYNGAEAQVYGSMSATTQGSNSVIKGLDVRNIAKWGTDNCGLFADWLGGTGDCLVRVENKTYEFEQRLMCATDSYSKTCPSGNQDWKAANNKVTLRVHPGEQIRVGIHFVDWDALPYDDNICNKANIHETGNESALKVLSIDDFLDQDSVGDGGCKVKYQVKTIKRLV